MDMNITNSTPPPLYSEYDDWTLKDLRSCFYMLSPQETYYKSVGDIPALDVKALNPWGMILILIEIATLKLTGKGHEWRLHSAIVSLSSTAMNEAVSICVLREFELFVYQWCYDNLRLMTLPWNSLTTFAVTLVAMEFGAYWWHRMSHELAVMWAAHELHHNSDDFNLSIAFRNSATISLFRWIFFVPLAFFGVPTSIMLTHYSLGAIFNGIIHHHAVPKFKKIIPGIGHVIDFVFVTPSHHRVHHACNKYCIDKNYGQYTILWDRLFGTFAEERDDEKLVFGSLTQPESYDMASLHFSSYKKIWEKFCSVDSWQHKIKALLYGPGWFPGTPRLGNDEDIPDVRGRKKYDPTYSFLTSLYLVANCACVFIFFMSLSNRSQDLSLWMKLLSTSYIFFAYTALGGIYDNKSYALTLEFLRILMFLGLSIFVPTFCLPESFRHNVIYYITYIDLLYLPFITRDKLKET